VLAYNVSSEVHNQGRSWTEKQRSFGGDLPQVAETADSDTISAGSDDQPFAPVLS
jgi:hypothetical protein